MARRYYSTTAVRTTLTAGINNVETVITVGSVSGFPGTRPYTLILDSDTANEEIVTVTDGTGTTLVVTRGVDGTAATSHSAGVAVMHGFTARDLDEPNAHVNASSGVHGLSGSVVGTTDAQTLTGKSMDGAVNTFTNIPVSAIPTLDAEVAAAAASAAAADVSADASAVSAVAADASAAAAAASAVAADASADAAALSASAASTSAGTATTQAGLAAASKTASDANVGALRVFLNQFYV